MKGIKIDNRLLVKEEYKSINRFLNTMSITLSIVPLIGETYTNESIEELKEIHFTISKDDKPDLWVKWKDCVNDELLYDLYEICSNWSLVYNESEPEPIYETVVEGDGTEIEVVTGMESETEEYIQKKSILDTHIELTDLFNLVEKYPIELIVI